MPTRIIQRVFGDGPDGKIVLQNSQIARLIENPSNPGLDIGDNWDHLRIGMRLRIDGPKVDITGDPRFFIGLCHLDPGNIGVGNLFFDNEADHCFGWRSNRASFGYVTPANMPEGAYLFFSSSNQNQTARKIGETINTVNSSSSGTNGYIAADVSHRSLFLIGIERATANLRCEIAYQEDNAAWGDLQTYEELLLGMDAGSLSSHASATTGLNRIGFFGSQAIDESVNGNLNAVNVGWDKSLFHMEISEIIIARIA